MSYADVDHLKSTAALYGIELPDDDACQRALDVAAHDLDGWLGRKPLAPTETQAIALAEANAVQAAYRLELGSEMVLGLEDGIASTGGVTFSLKRPERVSPAAAEIVSGVGLYSRSGTAAP